MSPPVAITLSWLMTHACTMQLWPVMLCMNSPSGHFHFLRLSAEAETNEYSCGAIAIARTAFLWLVSTAIARPATRSHNRTVESIEPVMICGSTACTPSPATVCSCPVNVCTLFLVRMSHTRATESRPPVTSRSRVGCRASEYTPERCPW